MDSKLVTQLKSLVTDLIAGDYEKLERERKLYPGIREGLEDFITDFLIAYPDRLTMPPDEAFETPLFESESTHPKIIEMYLWISGSESYLVLKTISTGDDPENLSLIIYDAFC